MVFGALEKIIMGNNATNKHSNLNSTLRWCLVITIGCLPVFGFAQRLLLDRIIVVVDQDVVLQSELDARLQDIRANAAANNRPLPEQDELQSEVLDALILENLQMQFAERVSIRFDDDTINRVLLNMAENSNMSFDEYVTTLEEAGVYLMTREQVRKQLTIQELQRGMVNSRLAITEQEIDNFLSSEMGREVMAAEFVINHMLVQTSDSDSAENREAKLRYAADLAARIREGEFFGEVFAEAQRARLFSVNSTQFDWRRADQLPNIFSEIVEGMEIADVEGPIEAGNGYHLIQLAQKRGGTDQVVKQTNLRHIMLMPNEIRDDDQSLTEIQEIREQIIAGEEFTTLARQNSDDANTVVGGGDLDWVNQGGLPPLMEEVVDGLEINDLSEPFRTEAGWHIVEVLGRRETDLSQEYSRSQAENTLRDRKFDLELQNWLIEIREEAFVELVD
jgi:peptidyl-prolyl cis-trans isomerase SurA